MLPSRSFRKEIGLDLEYYSRYRAISGPYWNSFPWMQ
jgi:hypothetical protein